MAELVYRSYRPGDEQAIVSLWNACLPQDGINARRFRNLVLLDANFDPQGMRLAWEGECLLGCFYAVRRLLPMVGTELEADNGWIPFFFIDKTSRKQGMGTVLLQEAVQFLRQVGCQQVFFSSYAPNYILPGIDKEVYPQGYQFLLKNGFRVQYSPVAMDCSLVGYQIPEEVHELKATREAEGYSFTAAQDSDIYQAIQFATQVFNPDWGRAIREGLLQGLPINHILIARKQGKMVGFCLFGGYEGVTERFGPFGVDPDEQGKGLGKILLYDCLAVMRGENLHGAWFLWTGEKSPAGHLYQKVGFQVTRRFQVMTRVISE